MSNELTENETKVLLILVFFTLLKVVYSTANYYSKYFIKSELGNNIYKIIDATKTFYSSLINLVSAIVGVYFIFVRQTKNIFFLVAFYALIFKAFMHFVVTYNLYKILNLSAENEKKLLEFKTVETIITNYVLLFLTLYILKVVFL